MIGAAIRTAILSDQPISEVINNRVYVARFEQARGIPAISINLDGLRPLPCRNPGGSRQGDAEIALLARTPKELAELTEIVHNALDYRDFTAEGYYIAFGAGVDDFDEEAEDILVEGQPTMYKRISYPLNTKKLN